MRLIGLDPGLRATGWGVIEAGDGRLKHVANGVVTTRPGDPVAVRLAALYDGIAAAIAAHHPEAAAVEETFVNRNAESTLRLGLARGAVLLAPARAGLPVAEYAANRVKKAVVGTGHAAKKQVAMMVRTLLPTAAIAGEDAADALAVAICHAHSAATRARWDRAVALAAGGGSP
ncbi:MAG TPA: crossover junction endodeoxyribonuclease RuvC [Alphaproteobacteria bacterium]|jgi:crossover junction endodeoxyribonuclease RuvC